MPKLKELFSQSSQDILLTIQLLVDEEYAVSSALSEYRDLVDGQKLDEIQIESLVERLSHVDRFRNGQLDGILLVRVCTLMETWALELASDVQRLSAIRFNEYSPNNSMSKTAKAIEYVLTVGNYNRKKSAPGSKSQARELVEDSGFDKVINVRNHFVHASGGELVEMEWEIPSGCGPTKLASMSKMLGWDEQGRFSARTITDLQQLEVIKSHVKSKKFKDLLALCGSKEWRGFLELREEHQISHAVESRSKGNLVVCVNSLFTVNIRPGFVRKSIRCAGALVRSVERKMSAGKRLQVIGGKLMV